MPPFSLNGMPAVGVPVVGVAAEVPAAPPAGGRLRWNRGRRSSSPFLSNLEKIKIRAHEICRDQRGAIIARI